MGLKIVAIGDVHFPYYHEQSFKDILKLIKRLKPDAIVQCGDLYDMFSFGRFCRSYIITPSEELRQGRELAERFWSSIQKAAPRKCSFYQLKGNHDERPQKRLLERFPEFESMSALDGLWHFSGVHTQPSERDELILDGILFQHGFRSRLGDHTKFNLMSTVRAHSHVGGVVYIPHKDEVFFEMDCGYIGDRTAIPMSYTKQRQITRWTLGVGVIDELGPRFIPW